ncbi:hypothetical protein [Shouchella lonarensis]|uniref:Internalin A n=1 Tax=Shouchella lonarensis TaxID=1464122 RepID=A0A1G6GJZ1_9BACI|nr:hypothetical protein [Shouchella lonarensis]SDB82352.1 hypothetical protein SAMN05421737_101173 [Shouchella lonarensis]
MNKHSFRFYNDIDRCISEINEKQVRSVNICEAFYGGDSIRFLAECPSVKEVFVSSDKITDYTPLYELPSLKHLTIDGMVKIPLALDRLILESLSITWSNKISGLERMKNLTSLALYKYHPKSRDLEMLSSLSQLKEITITESRIESLSGLQSADHLERLELINLRGLTSLSSSGNMSQKLSYIRIEGCKNITDHNYVAHFPHLENLILCNCGRVQSMQFVRNLRKLSRLVFLNTVIEDGDLTPCLGIDEVAFDQKKHYSHTEAQFKQENGNVKRAIKKKLL